MKTLLILRGVPASGKSTYAETLLKSDPQSWKRINMDSLRFMATDYVYSKDNERYIYDLRTNAITLALQRGFNVISDDTNLPTKTIKSLHDIAKKVGDVLVIEKFFDITREEAYRRDNNRKKKVGKDVIDKFFNKYINNNFKITPDKYYPKVESFVSKQDESLPKCVIVDIDGTIAKMNDRSPFDWSSVYDDDVNLPVDWVLKFITKYNKSTTDPVKIIFLSGRDGSAKNETIRWFTEKTKFTVKYGDNLFMRSAGDSRRDSIIKGELYENHINGKYNVLFVLDDRDQMITFWRQVAKLPCFQVDYGDF